MSSSTGAANTSKFEARRLQEERVQAWINDDTAPHPLSAMAIDGSERRQRALAEVDGMFAGLTYLEKVCLGDVQEKSQREPSWTNNDHFGAFFEDTCDISPTDFQHMEAQYVSEVEMRTNEIKRAWSGLRGLRKGLEHQHQRLKSIASEASSTNIQKLSQAYANPKTMGEMGILAYRDVLDFVIPDTLVEVVAFTAVSYVISGLLFQRGRVAKTDILSGLQRWGDCITNVDDRKVFASFASKMWPLEHLRTTDDIGKRSGQDDDKDSHHHRDKRSRLENNGPLQTLNFQPFQKGVEQSSPSKDIRDAALSTSRGIEVLSDTLPSSAYDQQHSFEVPSLEGDVMNITDDTNEEFDFGQFSYLLGDLDGAEVRLGQNNDPKSPGYYSSGLSVGHIPSETFLPVENPYMRPQSPPPAKECPSIIPDDPAVKQNIINFKCLNRDSDTAIFKLRDTPMFLVVLAFSQDTGDVFYRLSGCGKTVHATSRSSAYARERSKSEKRLRKDLFDPMKTSGKGNVVFLALLSVAKSFVILGSLSTLEHAQDYLVAISRELEVIEPGHEHVKFVRWLYRSSGSHTSSTEASTRSATKAKQENFPSVTQDAQAHGKAYRCDGPNCTKTYKTGSGLWKHKQKEHEENVARIVCPQDGCNFEDIRLDLVRLHYQRLHSPDLPDTLKARCRGQKRRRDS